MKFLSDDEDQLDLRLTMDELVLLRDVLRQHCNGGTADVPLYEAEALLRSLETALDRLGIVPSAD